MIPKLSIIVPVYNVEKYIRQCLESIKNQTFTNFEALLIDDGSPDGSTKICEEYAELDERFKVFHKENGGLASARNYGMNKARGEWITFVDSDDYLASDKAYEEMFLNDLSEVDMIRFGYLKGCNMNDAEPKLPSDNGLADGIINKSNFDKVFLQLGLHGGAWNCVFRRKKLGDLLFESIMPKEDVLFLQSALINMDKILIINQPYYFYRFISNSITMKYNPKAFPMALYYITEIQKIYEKSTFFNDSIMKELTLHHFVDSLMNAMKSDDEKLISTLIKEYADKFEIDKILTWQRIRQDKPIYVLYIFLKLKLYRLLVKGFKKKYA